MWAYRIQILNQLKIINIFDIGKFYDISIYCPSLLRIQEYISGRILMPMLQLLNIPGHNIPQKLWFLDVAMATTMWSWLPANNRNYALRFLFVHSTHQ